MTDQASPRGAAAYAANSAEARLAAQVAAIEPALVAMRRDLHAHPELAFQEHRTAGVVAAELARLGIPHRTGIGGTGVMGVIEGGRPGPTIAIRADMDALPIAEETGQPFASTVDGTMHACGHDIHTVTLLGAAAMLRDMAPDLAGRITLIFQPAEETLEGAAAMIAEGAGEGYDYALGFHNSPDVPVGEFVYSPGASCAASDTFEIVVQGKSGHAAHPYAAIDPIVAAAQLVGQLQTVVSREIKPLQPAVVTVGQFTGGTTFNIIPERVLLRGTVRTLHDEARDIAEAAIRRLCAGIAEGMRVGVTIDYQRRVPPLVNDARLMAPALASLEKQFGEVVHEKTPSMGAEDFSLFAARAPAFHLNIGSGAPGRADRLHNARYQPDERCIGLGVQALTRIAADLLA